MEVEYAPYAYINAPWVAAFWIPLADADAEGFSEIIAWCTDQFGPQDVKWCVAPSGHHILLADLGDSVAFRVRWC